ncbi:hypothetical protein GZ78_22355 [Endozoicomonas numazuensis]|uniref:Uncharacterized protein n=1 Tax=Endozoicomonas numazuensis TaxID=1137799 RepID=A0A081NDQ3_9GAMM|nr:hypothetical protein GZ78_22355 [Endozoicomonas numazuensis]
MIDQLSEQDNKEIAVAEQVMHEVYVRDKPFNSITKLICLFFDHLCFSSPKHILSESEQAFAGNKLQHLLHEVSAFLCIRAIAIFGQTNPGDGNRCPCYSASQKFFPYEI